LKNYCRNVSFVGFDSCTKTNLKPDLVVGMSENKILVEAWADLQARKICLSDNIHKCKKDTVTKL
jgi:hypothetical protein